MPIPAYRIVKTKWAASAFDGEGARRSGGRWNSVGTPIVYTAESRSLAALEVLVHLEGPVRAYSIIRCEIPETVVAAVPLDSLPDGWRRSPAPAVLAVTGDAWVASETSAVLKVPSAVVDGEFQYLLNPRHPEFSTIRIGDPESFPYDPRLVARLRAMRRGLRAARDRGDDTAPRLSLGTP